MSSSSVPLPFRTAKPRARTGSRVRALVAQRPELLALLVLAAVLNLWGLSRNGFANDYYSAAVRSMSTSWHAFLYGSFDQGGVMTVDKPPLAFWIQALSARAFGFNTWSLLVPQALMGVASVGLAYDMTRRMFGRVAGATAGLVLVLTPTMVAVSRHNNPDALLVLCCTAALWLLVRGLQDGRMRWLVWSGVCVGLGFEAKMAAALMVVPAIAAAWLWMAPRGRLVALRQLLAGGAAMVAVGCAWPLLVTLTPAGDRPWISGTSDNSVWSLIFGYNGLGRLFGQAGGPAGAGGGGAGGPGGGGGGGGANGFFGGDPGPLRLLNASLGGQGGWLLGFAAVAGIGLLAVTRLRRADARTGWLIAIGGSFAVTAVAFSQASGIFHPYYVSLLAPFTAALAGAGVGTVLKGGRAARLLGPTAIAGGVATEILVLHDLPGTFSWLPAVLVAGGLAASVALATADALGARVRAIALAAALGLLLLAPATWAVDTLGHATNGTFPTGGPASASAMGFGGFGGGTRGGPGGLRGGGARPAGGGFGGPPPGAGGVAAGRPGAGAGATGSQLTAPAASRTQSASGAAGGSTVPGAGAAGSSSAATGAMPAPGAAGQSASGSAGGSAQGAGAGNMFGGDTQSLSAALTYAKAHGGGTVAVSSQSGAAGSLITSGANVAAIGGFSGQESQVSISWLADTVQSGRIRWVLTSSSGPGGMRDGRIGSKTAMAAVAKACKSVSSVDGLYDCSQSVSALRALS
ncbi:MAG TPA: glycosyltransferase family 39 protein [Solirubrobacteraceae bacterium]|jgi:4-amino-4-deoxy-L-arabinose transferase-like glycosyltransferase|nr:glycosyltransferase family 39 protein [Solirubrobacteraceae bacterium]